MRNKSNLLAAIFAVGFLVSLAYAAATKFTNVEVSGTLEVDGSTTLGDATTDATTFNGQLVLLADAAPRTNVTPAAAGSLIRNSTANEVCIATGVLKSQWAIFGSTNTPCKN